MFEYHTNLIVWHFHFSHRLRIWSPRPLFAHPGRLRKHLQAQNTKPPPRSNRSLVPLWWLNESNRCLREPASTFSCYSSVAGHRKQPQIHRNVCFIGHLAAPPSPSLIVTCTFVPTERWKLRHNCDLPDGGTILFYDISKSMYCSQHSSLAVFV